MNFNLNIKMAKKIYYSTAIDSGDLSDFVGIPLRVSANFSISEVLVAVHETNIHMIYS